MFQLLFECCWKTFLEQMLPCGDCGCILRSFRRTMFTQMCEFCQIMFVCWADHQRRHPSVRGRFSAHKQIILRPPTPSYTVSYRSTNSHPGPLAFAYFPPASQLLMLFFIFHPDRHYLLTYLLTSLITRRLLCKAQYLLYCLKQSRTGLISFD